MFWEKKTHTHSTHPFLAEGVKLPAVGRAVAASDMVWNGVGTHHIQHFSAKPRKKGVKRQRAGFKMHRKAYRHKVLSRSS